MNMKCIAAVAALLAATTAPGTVSVAMAGASADGVLRFSPPQAVSCVAIRVDVPDDKMVTGLTWYNGSATESFAHILVASGSGVEPPALSEAVALADNVAGLDNAWSEVAFSAPIASQSGTLFIVLQYPINYTPEPDGPVLGVGYANENAAHHYYVSGDGTEWYRVTSRCRVLLEPVLADRVPGVVEKSRAETEAAPHELGLFASPNPFNPSTRVDLYLAAATTGQVRIVDVRGYQVAELYRGVLAQGQNSFVWLGRDGGGRGVASGVYWVLAETADQRLVKKVLLVK